MKSSAYLVSWSLLLFTLSSCNFWGNPYSYKECYIRIKNSTNTNIQYVQINGNISGLYDSTGAYSGGGVTIYRNILGQSISEYETVHSDGRASKTGDVWIPNSKLSVSFSFSSSGTDSHQFAISDPNLSEGKHYEIEIVSADSHGSITEIQSQ